MTAQTIMAAVMIANGIDDRTPSVSSTDFDVRQVLHFMNYAGRDVAYRAEWQRLSAYLTVAGSVSSVDLPADFQEMAATGAVRINDASFTPIRSVTSPEMWEMLAASPSAQPYYHKKDGKIYFSPALPVDGALIRYQVKNWVAGGKSSLSTDADTPLVPERLIELGAIWRLRRQKGIPFEDNRAEFEAEFATEFAADRGVE